MQGIRIIEILAAGIIRENFRGTGRFVPSVYGIRVSRRIRIGKRAAVYRRLIGIRRRTLIDIGIAVENEIFAVNFRRRAAEEKFFALLIFPIARFVRIRPMDTFRAGRRSERRKRVLRLPDRPGGSLPPVRGGIGQRYARALPYGGPLPLYAGTAGPADPLWPGRIFY